MKILILAAAITLHPAAARAQSADSGVDYPTRALRQIVPFPPGGGVDIVTRITTTKWSEVLGQQIVVENRAGAGGNLGADVAAKATPDGYTLFTCNIASHGVSPALYNALPFDAIRDLVPVGLIGKTPNVLVVNPSMVPARSVKEFVDYAKANAGKLNYSSPGVGTSPQMTMELFKLTAGLDIVHVPYKGGAPALAGVIGGEVMGMFGNLPEQLGAIKSGRTRALAVSTLKRSPQIPDVPTVAESGYPGFEVTVWYGVCTQSGVARPIIAKLNATLLKTLRMPEVVQRLAQSSIDAEPGTPDDFAAFIKAESERWKKVVADAHIPRQ